jgi:integrase
MYRDHSARVRSRPATANASASQRAGRIGYAVPAAHRFRKNVWQPATRTVGVPQVRFHDLRHTGNTLAATTGASTRELMARMGHASARAALIHQHATRERDALIASGLSRLIMETQAGRETPAR